MNQLELTDRVFSALGNRTRRQILDLVKRSPGCNVAALCQHFDISRIAVMKQLDVLVDAQLVISRKRGRSRELFFNAAPIQMIYDRWTDEYSQFWAQQTVDLKSLSESRVRAGRRNKPSAKSPSKPASKPSIRKGNAKVKP